MLKDFAYAVRKAAARLPEIEEGIACKGTALECSSFKVGKKTFLFLSATEAKVKLDQSVSEAIELASKEPGRYKIGANGWATLKFAGDAAPPLKLIERWMDESYRLMAGETAKKKSAKGAGKR
jgi:hypothetical protein